jgi:hypothetical protein
MKRLLVLFFMILALSACTEDYDAFGASDYRTLDELVFENQDGDARIFSDEHKIQVTLVAPSDSFVWDSVKVKKIGVSHFCLAPSCGKQGAELPARFCKIGLHSEKGRLFEGEIKQGE